MNEFFSSPIFNSDFNELEINNNQNENLNIENNNNNNNNNNSFWLNIDSEKHFCENEKNYLYIEDTEGIDIEYNLTFNKSNNKD